MAKNTDDKKSWFARHKIMSVLLAFVVLIVIIAISSSGNSNKSSSNSSNSSTKAAAAKQYRFADRADKQAKDVEVLPNETATVGGVQMTVSDVEYKTSLSEYETADSGKTYLIATVSLANTSTRTEPYNVYNFRVQTAGGQVLDNSYATLATPLNSGDLVAGGKVSGQISFEVPVEQGHQYIIWKPGISSDRAIVQTQ